MLLNSFFTYTAGAVESDKISATLKLNKEHDIYNGHFPGMPVTPGVCQVQMVQEVINDCLNSKYVLQSARDIKFLNFINPEKASELQMEFTMKTNTESKISGSVLLHADGVNFLKMRATFKK